MKLIHYLATIDLYRSIKKSILTLYIQDTSYLFSERSDDKLERIISGIFKHEFTTNYIDREKGKSKKITLPLPEPFDFSSTSISSIIAKVQNLLTLMIKEEKDAYHLYPKERRHHLDISAVITVTLDGFQSESTLMSYSSNPVVSKEHHDIMRFLIE